MLTKPRKLWYNTLILLLWFALPTSAQSLTIEEVLRLENLQLKQQLVEARSDFVKTLDVYNACVSDSLTRSRPQIEAQLSQAHTEWLTLVEQNHPGWTWDGTKLIRKPEPEKK